MAGLGVKYEVRHNPATGRWNVLRGGKPTRGLRQGSTYRHRRRHPGCQPGGTRERLASDGMAEGWKAGAKGVADVIDNARANLIGGNGAKACSP
jgi:hypothetical protein